MKRKKGVKMIIIKRSEKRNKESGDRVRNLKEMIR